MNDLISRRAAIDALNFEAELLRRALDDTDIVGADRVKYEYGLELIKSCISDIKELPSPQEDWNDLFVVCYHCGHLIHIERQ